jgi:hypothetical protein
MSLTLSLNNGVLTPFVQQPVRLGQRFRLPGKNIFLNSQDPGALQAAFSRQLNPLSRRSLNLKSAVFARMVTSDAASVAL